MLAQDAAVVQLHPQHTMVFVLVMSFVFFEKLVRMEHTGVSSDAFGAVARTRLTADPQRRTGHINLCLVFFWVRLSNFNLFFWPSKVTITNFAFFVSLGCLWGTMFRFLSRNSRPRSLASFMCPLTGVLTYSGSHGEEKEPHYKIDHMIVFDALLAGDPL